MSTITNERVPGLGSGLSRLGFTHVKASEGIRVRSGPGLGLGLN